MWAVLPHDDPQEPVQSPKLAVFCENSAVAHFVGSCSVLAPAWSPEAPVAGTLVGTAEISARRNPAAILARRNSDPEPAVAFVRGSDSVGTDRIEANLEEADHVPGSPVAYTVSGCTDFVLNGRAGPGSGSHTAESSNSPSLQIFDWPDCFVRFRARRIESATVWACARGHFRGSRSLGSGNGGGSVCRTRSGPGPEPAAAHASFECSGTPEPLARTAGRESVEDPGNSGSSDSGNPQSFGAVAEYSEEPAEALYAFCADSVGSADPGDFVDSDVALVGANYSDCVSNWKQSHFELGISSFDTVPSDHRDQVIFRPEIRAKLAVLGARVNSRSQDKTGCTETCWSSENFKLQRHVAVECKVSHLGGSFRWFDGSNGAHGK